MPIDHLIVDLACYSARLVMEVDGTAEFIASRQPLDEDDQAITDAQLNALLISKLALLGPTSPSDNDRTRRRNPNALNELGDMGFKGTLGYGDGGPRQGFDSQSRRGG